MKPLGSLTFLIRSARGPGLINWIFTGLDNRGTEIGIEDGIGETTDRATIGLDNLRGLSGMLDLTLEKLGVLALLKLDGERGSLNCELGVVLLSDVVELLNDIFRGLNDSCAAEGIEVVIGLTGRATVGLNNLCRELLDLVVGKIEVILNKNLFNGEGHGIGALRIDIEVVRSIIDSILIKILIFLAFLNY